MRTCLIYGQDGLDLDVTLNLESLYRKLGFNVFFSTRLYNSDIIVVTRAVDKPSEVSLFKFRQIHIYDYTGWDYDRFLGKLDHSITYIFTTDLQRKLQLPVRTGFPPDNIFLAVPPVDTKLWSVKLRKVHFDFIHIGNFKNIGSNDMTLKMFNDIIKQLRVNVWGSGWPKGQNFHGKASLFRVSSIYSRSEYALGLMYPYQRKNTFSGRFWHAPLNGCILLSEEAHYAGLIPGILQTDYSSEDIKSKLSNSPDRKKIQEDSRKFWDEQFTKTEELARNCLSKIDWQKSASHGFFHWIYVRIFNLMLRAYQKIGISALLRFK